MMLFWVVLTVTLINIASLEDEAMQTSLIGGEGRETSGVAASTDGAAAAAAASLSPDIITQILSPLITMSSHELAFSRPPGNPIIFWRAQGTPVSACTCSLNSSTGLAVSSFTLNEAPFQVTTVDIIGMVERKCDRRCCCFQMETELVLETVLGC